MLFFTNQNNCNELLDVLGKVLSSSVLAGAQRLRAFLEFVVRTAIASDGESLKEYNIGTRVYGRGADFDTRTDSIVRVDATRLRTKLAEYYAGPGRHDPIQIELPRGTYMPVFRRVPPEPEREREAMVPDNIAKSQTTAIAVLPFLNLNPEPETDLFVDGLLEELIHVLANVEALKVVARTSSHQFRNSSLDIRRIGEILGADALLEGSVRRHDSKVRVTARLISVSDGCDIWSERFDQDLNSSVVLMQEKIADHVVRAVLKRPLSGPAARLRPSDRSAHILYLKGRKQWRQQTPKALQRCLEHYQSALMIDPNLPLVCAGVADVHNLMGVWSLLPPREAFTKSKENALKALAGRDASGEAYSALAWALAAFDWDWNAAEMNFRTAIERSPSNADIRHAFAVICLMPMARFRETFSMLDTALSLDPLSLPIASGLASALFCSRRAKEGIAHCLESLAIDRGYWRLQWNLGVCYEQENLLEKAEERLRSACEICPLGVTISSLIHCLGLQGQTGKAGEMMDRLLNPEGGRYVSQYDLAIAYLGMGEIDKAILCLESSLAERSSWLIWLGVDPRLDPVRQHPRMDRVWEKMRWPDQFKAIAAGAGKGDGTMALRKRSSW